MKTSAVLSLLLATALAAPRNTFQGVDLAANADLAERQLDILNGIPIVGPLLSGLLGGGKGGAGGALDSVTDTVGGLTGGLVGGDGSKSSKGSDSKGGLGDTVSDVTKGLGVRDEMMIDDNSRVVERQLGGAVGGATGGATGGASGGPSLGSIFSILDKIISSVGDKVPELKDPAKKVTDALDSFKEAAGKVDPSKLKMAMPTTN